MGGGGAVIAFVVGATLLMGHLAAPSSGQEGGSGFGGAFKFVQGHLVPQKAPVVAVKPTPTAEPSPSAEPSATPKPTASPTNRADEQKKLLAKKKAESEDIAAAKEAALARAATKAANLSSKAATTGSFASNFSAESAKERATVGASAATAAKESAPTSASAAQPAAATPAQVALAPKPAEPVQAAPNEVYAPDTIVDARFLSRAEPDYPEIAREQNAHGSATILVTVGPKGNIINVRLSKSSGFPLLDRSAMTAVRGSQFAPPFIDNKPATETYRVVYDFSP